MMEEEKKKHPAGEDNPVSRPRIRSEYSHLFEDDDEDPYEQIFRRVEDHKEENTGGMPVDKDVAVAGLFEESDELPEVPKVPKMIPPKAKTPKIPKAPKAQIIRTRITELLKKLPHPVQPVAPQREENMEQVSVAEVQIGSEPVEPKVEVPAADIPEQQNGQPEESTPAVVPVQTETVPEVPEKAFLPAEAVEESEHIARFARKKPKQAEEIPADPASNVVQPEVMQSIPVMEAESEDKAEAGEEPVIVFAPIGAKTPEQPEYTEYMDLMSRTEDVPKVIPVTEAEVADETGEEPVVVFAPIGAKPSEQPEYTEYMDLMSRTEETPKIIPAVEAEVENETGEEPVIVFAPIGAKSPEQPEYMEYTDLMSRTEDVPKVIPVMETGGDVEDDGEPVIVFAPISPKQAEDAVELPAEKPVAEDEEVGNVPEELPAWNVKVEIPEEIKDVEGKLKMVSVEELPIHIFTEAHPQTPEPSVPEIPVPAFGADVPEEPETEEPAEVQPEEPAVMPQDAPETPEPEQPEEEELPEEPAAEEPPQPICVQWEEETFRPYRGKEIKVISKERLYAPVEKEYQRMVAPGRKKNQQERRRRKRQEACRALKEVAVEKAVHVRDCTVTCAKKTARSLHPKVVYGKVKNIAVSTAETGTYKRSAMLQLVVSGLAGLVLLALLIVNKYDIPLQVELSQYRVPVLFATIHAVAVGATMLLSFRTTVGGTISLFTRHCDRGTDGLVSLLLWGCLAQSVLSIFFYGEIVRGQVSLYAPVCMLVLFMDAWGKLLNHRRVCRAMDLMDSAPGADCAGILMEDTELQNQVDANVPDRLTVIRMPEADRSEFIRNAVRRDGSQKVMRFVTGPLVLAAVLVGALEFSVSGSWMTALAACTAVLCISVPLSVTMCMTVPALRGGKRMGKSGAAVASWDAVVNFGEASCVVIRDEDLFPAFTVKLINVKVIRERLLETAVVSAAAVLHRVGGPLRSVFDRILTGEVDGMPKAERVRTEENGGVVGWVNGLRIIIGKGEHLQKYGIQPPSRDYENKNCPEGKQFVYLAAGGELVAMFVLEYRVDPEIRRSVQTLSDTGCDLAVCTADANLRKEFLAASFDLDEDGVELLNGADLQTQADAEEDTRNQLILRRGSVSLFDGLTACIRMKGAMELASALQFAGMLLGILLIVVFSATGAIYHLSNMVIALFKLFWLTAVLLIPALRRM